MFSGTESGQEQKRSDSWRQVTPHWQRWMVNKVSHPPVKPHLTCLCDTRPGDHARRAANCRQPSLDEFAWRSMMQWGQSPPNRQLGILMPTLDQPLKPVPKRAKKNRVLGVGQAMLRLFGRPLDLRVFKWASSPDKITCPHAKKGRPARLEWEFSIGTSCRYIACTKGAYREHVTKNLGYLFRLQGVAKMSSRWQPKKSKSV